MLQIAILAIIFFTQYGSKPKRNVTTKPPEGKTMSTKTPHLVIHVTVTPERSQLPAPDQCRASDFFPLHTKRGVDNMQLPSPDLSIAYGFIVIDSNRRAPLQ